MSPFWTFLVSIVLSGRRVWSRLIGYSPYPNLESDVFPREPGSFQGCPGGAVVKSLPAKQETQVRSLGREESLEKEMVTHSNIPDWRILWTEKPGGLQFMGSQGVRHD